MNCFATRENAKCTKFYSRFYSNGCAGVDAFNFNWHGEVVWVVPPPRLGAKTIRHFLNCKSKGVLILPFWPSQSYWPLILDSEFDKFVVFKWEFPGEMYVVPGSSGNSVFKPFKGVLLVLYVNCEY